MSTPAARQFVVATPGRSVLDSHALVLEEQQRLRQLMLGTRRGTRVIPSERTRLLPAFGLLNYAAARSLSPFRAESVRFAMHPWFDWWVKRHLQPGDHVFSSYGYANEAFKYARLNGGRTFLDGGNSHPENFWQILTEENARWKCSTPPIAAFQHRRAVAMMADVDYVFAPSKWVADSFLARGFRQEQILALPYPVDLSCFAPATESRPPNRPLTIINTGQLSLRKGTPYLLEAFRLIHQRHPTARFLLTRTVHNNVVDILGKYRDLPIDWSEGLPHAQLAERLRSADIYVLPSLEEGLVRTGLEALACGLPIVVTPNSGVNDFVEQGVNGVVVPVRDPVATSDAVLALADRILASGVPPRPFFDPTILSFDHFRREFLRHLSATGTI